MRNLLQAVGRRVNGQGFNRTHDIPDQYDGNSIKYILGSPTTVVYLSEIDSLKKGIDVLYTTISGTLFLMYVHSYIKFKSD